MYDVLSSFYKEVKAVLSGTVTKGAFVTLDTNLHGFYMTAGVSGDNITVVYECDKVATDEKTTGEAWTAGQLIYRITATGKLTTTAGANVLIGVATEAAASAAASGVISFNGLLAYLKA